MMVKHRSIRLTVGSCIVFLALRTCLNFFEIHAMLEKEVQQNAVEVQLNNAFTESRSGWESIDIDPVTNIRKWGCALDTTPLIYIHIGKCGGGSAYSRLQPVKEGYGGNKPRFCHRIHPLYLTNVSDAYKVHQGCLKCDAVTPLGHAIGCREPKGFCSSKKKYIRLSTIRCRSCEGLRQVYFGHNYLGSELHWLPKDFLSEWWETFFEPKIQSSESKALIQNQFRGMENRTQSFCSVNDTKRFRPSTADDYDQLYSACLRPLQSSMDEISLLLYPSIESETKRLTIGNHGLGNLDWSPFYASMPVLRATVVREPFSWLVTKYFWHLQSRVQKELGENKNERTKPNKYTKPEKLRHISQTEYEDLRQQVVDRRAAERYAEEMEHGSKYKYNKRTYTRDVELKNKTKQEEKAIKKEKAAKQEKLKELGDKCLDLEFATTDLEKRDFSVSIEAGWIHRFSIQYLLYLCGEGKYDML